MKKTNLILSVAIISITILTSQVSLAKSENANNSNDRENASVSSSPSVSASPSISPSGVPKNKEQINAQEHRSAVANFVQSLVRVANRDGGAGEQVRVIAQQQNESEASTTAAIEQIDKRSNIKTFLFGSDYKNLGALRSEMVQTRNRIDQLTRLAERTQNASSTIDTTEIKNQIQTLEAVQTKVENFVKAQEGKFSLFGWLVKLFNK